MINITHSMRCFQMKRTPTIMSEADITSPFHLERDKYHGFKSSNSIYLVYCLVNNRQHKLKKCKTFYNFFSNIYNDLYNIILI